MLVSLNIKIFVQDPLVTDTGKTDFASKICIFEPKSSPFEYTKFSPGDLFDQDRRGSPLHRKADLQ